MNIKKAQKNNKTIRNQSVGYKGTVKVKYTDKNGKSCSITKSNSGELGLFEFLIYALQSNNETDIRRPKYIQLYHIDDNETPIKLLTQKVPFRGTPVITNGDIYSEPTLTFQFQIPSYLFDPSINSDINELRIYNDFPEGDNRSLCATITNLTITNPLNTTATNIIIYWTLRFTNLPEEGYYTINANITNGKLNSNYSDKRAYPRRTANIVIVPDEGYVLPQVINQSDLTNASVLDYNNQSGFLIIENIQGNVILTLTLQASNS